MRHTTLLREVCKFLSGLVAADLITGLWLLAGNFLPGTYFGFFITQAFAWLWVGFDLFALLVLIHYAWNANLLKAHVTSKGLFFVVGVIFAAVAIVHFLRLVFGWNFAIGDWMAPMWISWVGVVVASYISYASFHFAAKHGRRI